MGGRVRVALAAVLSALLMVGIVSGSPVAAADGPTVSLGEQSGLERDSTTGSVFVPVYLSEPAAEPVVVSFHTNDDTAVAGQDYTRWGTPAAPRTVTVPAGALQSTINVPVLTDPASEGDETFTVQISSVSGGDAVLGDDTATATIIDSDPASATNPAVTVSSPTIVEGDTGQRRAQFLIHLSRAPATPVTVAYATSDDTAVAGEDYVAKLPGTVVFAPGQISKTIDVLVNSNTVANAAGSTTCAVLGDGTARCWGDNTIGQLGNGTTGGNSTVPVTATGLIGAVDVSAGGNNAHTCALLGDGTTRCWGWNNYGQLGDGTTTSANVPVPVTGITDGSARCWGYNSTGQLGDDTNTNSSVPVTVSGLP